MRRLRRHIGKVNLVRTTGLFFTVLVLALVCRQTVFANDFESMKDSVVKISSQSAEGKARTGTGFVVRVDGDTIYIVTASHVIEGDPSPQVQFFSARDKRIEAKVGRLQGGEPKGVAYLIVRDKNIATKGMKPLGLNLSESKSGQEVFVIGFGLGQGEWGVIRATIAGMDGSDIILNGGVAEGNSGSPVIENGQVIGLVTQARQSENGIASPAWLVNRVLKGWGVKATVATEFTEGPNELHKQVKPDQPDGNPPSPKVTIPPAINLAGQYGGRSYSQAADGQQYTCDFTAVFTQAGAMAKANFQNNCGDYGTIQGQVTGNSYQAKLNSMSLGSCELAAEIQQGGNSLNGQFQCLGLVGRFSMSRQ